MVSKTSSAIKTKEKQKGVKKSEKILTKKSREDYAEKTANTDKKHLKPRPILIVVGAIVSIGLVAGIAFGIHALIEQKWYNDTLARIAHITIEGDYNISNEVCAYDSIDAFKEHMSHSNYNVCLVSLNIPAEINENGVIAAKTLKFSSPENTRIEDITSDEPVMLENGEYKLPEYTIPESKYAEMSMVSEYRCDSADFTISAIPLEGSDKIKEVTDFVVTYVFSDEDRATLEKLEQRRQERIAEEKRRAEEEKARKEAEEKAKKEAEAATKAAHDAWATLTYEKYTKIKVGMTASDLQELFDYKGTCSHTSDVGTTAYVECKGNGGKYSSATLAINTKTGKVTYKMQYGLR